MTDIIIILFIVLMFISVTAIICVICDAVIKVKKLSLECKHKWKTIEKRELREDGKRIGIRYIQQCEHCGLIHNIDCN